MTKRFVLGITAAVALMAAGAAHAAGPLGGDPAKGSVVFKQQCMICHAAKAGQEGAAPSLYGVVGRDDKGQGYLFSDAR